VCPPPGRQPNPDIRYYAVPHPGPEHVGKRLMYSLPTGERVSTLRTFSFYSSLI
jgi:hypothetical protein